MAEQGKGLWVNSSVLFTGCLCLLVALDLVYDSIWSKLKLVKFLFCSTHVVRPAYFPDESHMESWTLVASNHTQNIPEKPGIVPAT